MPIGLIRSNAQSTQLGPSEKPASGKRIKAPAGSNYEYIEHDPRTDTYYGIRSNGVKATLIKTHPMVKPLIDHYRKMSPSIMRNQDVGQRISDRYPNAGIGSAPGGPWTKSPITGTMQGAPYTVEPTQTATIPAATSQPAMKAVKNRETGEAEYVGGAPVSTAAPTRPTAATAPAGFTSSKYYRGNDFTAEERQTVSQMINLGAGQVFDPSNAGQVKQLQQALKQGGYNLGSYGVDGRFGGMTISAAREYLKASQPKVAAPATGSTWATNPNMVTNNKPAFAAPNELKSSQRMENITANNFESSRNRGPVAMLAPKARKPKKSIMR